MIDYGTIKIHLHPNMEYDQLISTVRMCVENQLQCTWRPHFNEILRRCTDEAMYVSEPMKINHMYPDFTFVTILEFYVS